MGAGVVQCGWCPLLLANNHAVWYRHFDQVHRVSGYSILHVVSSDWDISELATAVTTDGAGGTSE